MNIVIFNWRDINHPLSGGAETSLFEHAKYWKKKGSNIIWFSSDYPGALQEENIAGIKFVRKGSHYSVFLWGFLYYIFKKFGKIDLVIDSFHFIPFFTPLYIRSSKIIGLIHELAGKLWYQNLPYPLANIGYYLEPFFFKFYSNIRFITVSNSTKKELIKVGIFSKNIKIIHNGVKQIKNEKNINKEKTPTLIFLGRISLDKGIEELLEIFIKVKKDISNMVLWIVGREEKPGIMTNFLKKNKTIKEKESIKYFGFVTEKKKFELLKKAWILVHPSKKEGWGLNVIEAATQGTPTVGYNIEGLRDSVQDGKTGILVDYNNSYLLAKAISNIINNKSKLKILSKNSIQWSKNFNWDTSTRQSWDLLKQTYEIKNKK